MKKILIAGAGRSSSFLVKFMLDHSISHEWQIRLGDFSEELAKSRIENHPGGFAFHFDVNNKDQREEEIKNSDIVISMLPPFMHDIIAKDCIHFKKNMVTASYVSKEIESLSNETKEAGICIISECGLDPGIDHMSAMEIIEKIKNKNGEILSFTSFTGGLIASGYDNNPWKYKFTWNPRNVILAGQGTARYIKNNKYHYIPYNRLFLETENIEVEGYGKFEAYANRDSLSYRKHYGLDEVPSMLRGTLRMHGFCEAWNVFVKLGLTDDSYEMENSSKLTYREITEAFLPTDENKTTEECLADFIDEELDSDIMRKIVWTGILSDTKPGLPNASPARILQHLLEQKWGLNPGDKDMVIMYHRFEYKIGNEAHELVSSLVVKGENDNYTAMAKTVGLPMAIVSKLLLEGKIKTKGVVIPVIREIYTSVLKELEKYEIKFVEKQIK